MRSVGVGVGVGIGAAAAVGSPESARAQEANVGLPTTGDPMMPENKEFQYEKSTQNFVRGLVQLVSRLDPQKNLLEMTEMSTVLETYFNAFCEERKSMPRTVALDTVALLHARGEIVTKYPGIDGRIALFIDVFIAATSEQSAQDLRDYVLQQGKSRTPLDPHTREG